MPAAPDVIYNVHRASGIRIYLPANSADLRPPLLLPAPTPIHSDTDWCAFPYDESHIACGNVAQSWHGRWGHSVYDRQYAGWPGSHSPYNDPAPEVKPPEIPNTSPTPASDLAALLSDLDPAVRSGVEALLKDLIGQTKAYYSGSTDDGSFCTAATNYFRDARRLKPGRPVRPSTPPKRPVFSRSAGRAAEGLRLGRVLHDLLAIDVEPAEGMIISGGYRYHLHPGLDRDGLIIERRAYDNRRWMATQPVFTPVEAEAARYDLDGRYGGDAADSRRKAADRANTVIHPTKTVLEFGPLDSTPVEPVRNRAASAAQKSIDEMNAEVAAAFFKGVNGHVQQKH